MNFHSRLISPLVCRTAISPLFLQRAWCCHEELPAAGSAGIAAGMHAGGHECMLSTSQRLWCCQQTLCWSCQEALPGAACMGLPAAETSRGLMQVDIGTRWMTLAVGSTYFRISVTSLSLTPVPLQEWHILTPEAGIKCDGWFLLTICTRCTRPDAMAHIWRSWCATRVVLHTNLLAITHLCRCSLGIRYQQASADLRQLDTAVFAR